MQKDSSIPCPQCGGMIRVSVPQLQSGTVFVCEFCQYQINMSSDAMQQAKAILAQHEKKQ